MQLSSIFTIASLAIAAKAATVSYDPGYDITTRSLDVVSCSDGANGLETRYGWKTQGDIPRFPYIGGVEAVDEWNSPSCGTCWKLSYKGRSITVLAIDQATTGYNIALEALDDLTNGQGEKLGRIDATATKVAASECGIKKA